ncbi:penicillin-binding transpeptidase domain-containing protein [Rhizomonospora bruguierae]|uniref:penicillin-binding transpeptidase domain-containing protein n=1 Tax=Rhizomonospora bruguierae TaxID=1581705 RepID=UPI001BCAB411|nr:penicillin-binding transpeptidase domain-containing protein [Micromonospora sp. NBRC 107566]
MRRVTTVAAALAAALLATGGLAACSGQDEPKKTLGAFLAGWPGGTLDAIGFASPSGQRIPADQVAEELRGLAGEFRDTPPALSIAEGPKVVEDVATATVTVDWPLPGGARWKYPTTVRLGKVKEGWQILWEPAIVHPELTAGDKLGIRREPAQRGAVTDGAGQPLVAPRNVVRVGVQPNAVQDEKALIRELDAAFKSVRGEIGDVGLADLPARLKAADGGAFVDVVTLREPVYLKIKPRIYRLPGTKFVAEKRDLAPTREFARALLGSVDDVQRDDLVRSPDKYGTGDKVGHGGLQGAYDDRLRGTAATRVVIVTTKPDKSTSERKIYSTEAAAGQPVHTTLDVKVQNAADQALASDTKHRSALVAIRISDNAVLAAANGPAGQGQNFAFTAQVPPGSTFKVVSALGLLDNGAVTLDSPVACPARYTVEGRSYKNSHDFSIPGQVPFRTDFARSCNTAFASLYERLGPDGLNATATTLGIGGTWNAGLDAFTGSVGTGGGATARAEAMFGQGDTIVSPLAMAAATAAVARGHWQQPRLVTDPAPQNPAPDGPRLKPESIAALKTMMREVVTQGTATQLKSVPGGPVYGKTGTAEYDDNSDHSHAWFVGWRGDVAFAVFVEAGGNSTDTAVPLAGRFLRAF